MSRGKEELIFKAQIAEKAERYDDMVDWMRLVVESSAQGLTIEERNLLSVAFKNAVGHRRLSWRMIKQLEEKQRKRGNTEAESTAAEYRDKVKHEINALCKMLIQLLDTTLMKSARDHDAVVFYLKLLGDYHRYVAEFSEGQSKKDAIFRAIKAYKEAMQQADANLRPPHPVRLGLMLNYAVFTFEVLEQHKEAISMAEDAYRSAGTVVNSPDYRDTTLVMQLLKDNIRVWREQTS